MSAIPKNVLRGIVKENDFKNPGEIYAYFKDAFKDLLQEMLEAEMDATLGCDKNDVKNKQTDNYRNGHSQKTVKSQYGDVELSISRDRNGDFEPKIVPKYKRDISGIEEKIIALYARGMSTRDIYDQVKDLYGIEVSAEMVSKITGRIVPEIKEWQSRPLDAIYPFIFLDAIYQKIKEDGHILNRAAYVVLGVDVDGNKDILGIWIGENESSKFWLGILNELKNRGVEDVLMFCVDGLTGLKEAIEAAFPKSEIQRCIIHQLRNSFKYVSYKDLKAFSKDFRQVYTAASEDIALEKPYEVKEKWGMLLSIKKSQKCQRKVSRYFKNMDQEFKFLTHKCQ